MVTPDALDGLEVYLVGGAVRDRLMGLPVRDRDWVVVGSTPDEMLCRGFKPVGQQFPVFLHPQTREEYALARTERKTGPGYTGFEFSTASDISIEQDLSRRDLTINAIAQTSDGTLIDPFDGETDLENEILRHVSSAFTEDPVRVLRVARFKARFGFSIAPETRHLMKVMVENGEVDTLVAERTWAELRGALGETRPSVFFELLRESGALARILPEIDALFGVPQNAKYHPEIDTGIHTLLVVDQAAGLSDDLPVRFAALVHDLGKAITPEAQLPSHYGHEWSGLGPIKQLCQRLRIPNEFRDLALLACQVHLKIHRARELKPATILELLETLDAFRRPRRLEQALLVAEADMRGRTGREMEAYPQAAILRAYFKAATEIDTESIARRLKNGPAIAQGIRELRIEAIKTVRNR
jgi:tRNA nucleotidyltransferase (CCA-adding enzyme)